MFGRRSFMGWLISRPLVGVAAAETVNVSGVGVAPEVVSQSPSPLDQKVSLLRSALERRDNLRDDLRVLPPPHYAHLPVNIENKKSWSNAFKAHCYAHDKYNRPSQNVWTLSEQDLIDVLDRATPEFLKPEKYDLDLDS